MNATKNPVSCDDRAKAYSNLQAQHSAIAFQSQICILAIVSGSPGAMAFFFPTADVIAVDDIPTVAGEIDAARLAARITQMSPDLAIVELATSRPARGTPSAFRFGCGFGIVLGVIAANGVPLHLVKPAKWKRHFHLGADKKEARALALRLWPMRSDLFDVNKNRGRAKAALLARYAADVIVKKGGGQ